MCGWPPLTDTFGTSTTHAPERLEQAQRILGVPFKRTQTGPINYLGEEEIRAVLGCVPRTTRAGCRDYALLALFFNTGARVQEVVDLSAAELATGIAAAGEVVREGTQDQDLPTLAPDGQV